MKIPESIIAKFELKPSGKQCGASFLNNLIIYKSDVSEFQGVLFMECDLHGAPCKEITALKNKRAANITPEFMESMERATVLDCINKLCK